MPWQDEVYSAGGGDRGGCGAVAVFAAHGASPAVHAEAAARGCRGPRASALRATGRGEKLMTATESAARLWDAITCPVDGRRLDPTGAGESREFLVV